MAGENIALLLAVLIGLSLGALGSGGSIVTLPVLVYVAGVAPSVAVGMSMAIVGGTSLTGAYLHWRNQTLRLKPIVLFSATGIMGAYLGSLGTHQVSSSTLLLLFSALMFVVSTLMIAQRPSLKSSGVCFASRCIPAGFGVGLVTGFLGVGGGFVIVPALVWFAGLPPRRAIGTSLAIIAINSAAGLGGQLRYTQLDWLLTGKFLACSLIGMGLGVPLARQAPEWALRKGFAAVVLAVAVAIAWQVLTR